MPENERRLEGKDIVAIVTILTGGVLIALGHNGAITMLLGTIVGWYFGRKK